MKKEGRTIDQRLDSIETQIKSLSGVVERMSISMVKGFTATDKHIDELEISVRSQIDIYARAVDAYAKQSETFMIEMLALGKKVDRLEQQIEQIAKHLNLKLSY